MKNSLVGGALILTICAIIGKVIGAFYRIPFAMIAGAEGVGLYQLVYPMYALMLTISTSGLPSSISKLLSDSYARNEHNLAKKYFKYSFIVIIALSLAGSIIIAAFSKTIASLQGNVDATFCYVAISPAVFFAGIVAGIRGYFQAKENMLPSAISGLIEQVCKVGIGLVLALVLRKFGIIASTIGILFGVTIAEVVASLFMVVCLLVSKKKTANLLYNDKIQMSKRQIISKIFSVSLPIAFGGLIMPLTMLIDSTLIVRIMSKYFEAEHSTMFFGLQSGVVGSLINLPIVASVAVQTTVLPKISKENAKNDIKKSKMLIQNAFLFVLLVAIPSAICFMIYSKQIIFLLYGKTFSLQQIEICSKILRIGSLNIIFLSLAQVTAGILQGLGKVKTPVLTLLIGAAIKVLSVIFLVSKPNINIYGAEISDILCYLTVSIVNIIIVYRYIPIKMFKEIRNIAIISMVVFVVAYFSNKVLQNLISSNLALTISGMTTVLTYGLLILFMIRSGHIKRDKVYVNSTKSGKF